MADCNNPEVEHTHLVTVTASDGAVLNEIRYVPMHGNPTIGEWSTMTVVAEDCEG